MRVAVDQAVPRYNILVPYVLENELGFGQVAAFGVEVDEAVGEVYAGRGAVSDDLSVQCAPLLEILLLGALDKFSEEGTTGRRTSHQLPQVPVSSKIGS